MKNKTDVKEAAIHGIFLLLGLVSVGCVVLISGYLIVSGIPAIAQIGPVQFLFGKRWASSAATPQYGILPFLLTSLYGTVGAIALGVPVGFFAAVYLAKLAPDNVRKIGQQAVSLLAGIPSVVYGLAGMMVLVPGIRVLFGLPDGASLLAAILVLAVMILPPSSKCPSPPWKRYQKSMKMPPWPWGLQKRRPGSGSASPPPKAALLPLWSWV